MHVNHLWTLPGVLFLLVAPPVCPKFERGHYPLGPPKSHQQQLLHQQQHQQELQQQDRAQSNYEKPAKKSKKGGSSSAAAAKRKRHYYLSKRGEDAFTVRIVGCTGTLISDDWVLTAAHCFRGMGPGKANENGDREVTIGDSSSYSYVDKPVASRLKKSDLWTEPISASVQQQGMVNRIAVGDGEEEAEEEDLGEWRRAEKVILHKKFQGEALSWKGYDFALLKLAPRDSSASKSKKDPRGIIAPACLASHKYNAGRHWRNTYFSGYGRRYIPHCLTNGAGPVKYGVCGRPVACTKDHRTRECGLNFLYQGKKHKKCLTNIDTPSATDPLCSSLRKSHPKLHGEERLIHILQGKQKYLTTCYPKRAPKGSRGWCTTRAPGVDDDEEPGPTKGWGFCSGEESQKHCNEETPEKQNTTAYRLGILNSAFCKLQLGKNLRVEQPEVKPDEYVDIEGKAGLFCVGRNYSHHFERDLFYQRTGDGHFSKVSWSDKQVEDTLQHHSHVQQRAVSGGPVCFGDSGGPLFQLVYEPARNLVRPVLIGVFSFILWGTCQGEDEPGYFGRVDFAENWIRQYVGDSVCWAGNM